MNYKIMSNDDCTKFVKSLNPIVLASEFEAQVFSSQRNCPSNVSTRIGR